MRLKAYIVTVTLLSVGVAWLTGEPGVGFLLAAAGAFPLTLSKE